MTPQEAGVIATECLRRANAKLDVQLVTYRDRPPSGERVYLEGPRSPRSREIACVAQEPDGRWRVVAWYDPLDVLAWLATRGLVEVKGL